MSASVEFVTTMIHLAYSQATYVSLDVSAETAKPKRHGEVQVYASGRRAAVLYPDSDERLEFKFAYTSRTPVDQIVAWVRAGELLMIRDLRGRKVYGHVFAIDVKETAFNANVVSGSFRIEPVYFSEAV